MEKSQRIFNICRDNGINFFASLPCSNLDSLISILETDDSITYTRITREEEGMGILSGAYLGGNRPALVMQSTGLGNSVNALKSLVQYYNIPLILLVSHRGTKGEKIDAQRPLGQSIKQLLDAIGLKWYNIESKSELSKLDKGIKKCLKRETPGSFLFPINFWEERSGDL